VRGGVLADEIGYGKTALIIGLLDSRHDEATPALPDQDAGFFFSSRATLICVPSNLHQQWVDEIAKFTGKAYRVLRLRTGMDMAKATVQDLAEADIVVCNYQLLWGSAYEKRRADLVSRACPDKAITYEEIFGNAGKKVDELPLEDLRRGTWGFMRDPSRHPWADLLPDDDAKVPPGSASWKRLRFPVLEQFFWRRIVLDEFHELEALQFIQRASLQYLRSHYRWGLTGTPALGAAQHVAAMASLLRVDVAGPVPDSKPAGSGQTARPWAGDTDGVTVENCRRFLDACVRQNTAQLPQIRTQEHLVLIRHTPQERALYLAASCGVETGASGNEVEATRNQRLLVLCSHFSAEQLRSASVGEECGRVLDMREEAVSKARELFRSVLGAFEGLKALLGPTRTCHAAVEQRLKDLASSQDAFLQESFQLVSLVQAAAPGQDLQQLARGLRGSETWKRVLKRAFPEPEKEEPVDAAKAPPKAPSPPTQAELEKALKSCGEAVDRALNGFLTALQQKAFLQQTLNLVSEGSDKSARACSICFEEDLQLQQLGITPCAHVFCLACLTQLIAKTGKCGICRHELGQGDAHPLMLEMSRATAEESLLDDDALCHDKHFQKYGTKLGKIVRTLRRIKADDESAKCIVFCQWECLLQKISAAFRDFGIKHGQLRGSIYNRMRALSEFKRAESGVDVLLLSLEQSASGTNLTCANHVLLVHPMSAATQEQAVAFELQAIGRVRRWGQQRREVHVWRFCTVGTVEEEITRRHQQEVWERGPRVDASKEGLELAAPGPEPTASGRATPQPSRRSAGPGASAGPRKRTASGRGGKAPTQPQPPPGPAAAEGASCGPAGGSSGRPPGDALGDGATAAAPASSASSSRPACPPPPEAGGGRRDKAARTASWQLVRSPAQPIEL